MTANVRVRMYVRMGELADTVADGTRSKMERMYASGAIDLRLVEIVLRGDNLRSKY